MTQEYYTVLTNAGLEYESRSKAEKTPINLSYMAVGDGGGASYNPSPEATALRRETHRQQINALLQNKDNPTWLEAEALLPEDVGGWTIREVGIYTDTGILYAIGKYPDSIKPLLPGGATKQFYVRAIFQTSNAANVTLIVDNNVVAATRSFVIDYVEAELSKRDFKNSVRVATTTDIALAGLQTVDDEVLVEDDPVLVKDQKLSNDNGLYLASSNLWKRLRGADTSLEVTAGLCVPVESGTVNRGSIWQLVTEGPITLGTTGLVFEMASGRTGVAPGTYNRLAVNARGQVVAGENSGSVDDYGLGLELALPIQMLPLPTVASSDGRLPVKAIALAKQGGQVSIEPGTTIGIAQMVGPGPLARLRNFTSTQWTSPALAANTEYFLRAKVVKDELLFYVQKGGLFDEVPASYQGIPNGVNGGGFPSTPVDICIAQVRTGALETVAQVRLNYNLPRPTWTKNLNGAGVLYLPLDPHARGARMMISNIVPPAGAAPTTAIFDVFGWWGFNHTYMVPGVASIGGHAGGWAEPLGPVPIFTNNSANEVAITTLSASFDHAVERSLWQSYQAEHPLGATTAGGDEHLFGMGIKSHSQPDYDKGIALNFTDAVNMHVTWELIR